MKHAEEYVNEQIIREEGRKEERERILKKLIKLMKSYRNCDFLKGSTFAEHEIYHDVDRLIDELKKSLDKKNLGYGRSYGYPKKPLDRGGEKLTD